MKPFDLNAFRNDVGLLLVAKPHFEDYNKVRIMVKQKETIDDNNRLIKDFEVVNHLLPEDEINDNVHFFIFSKREYDRIKRRFMC